MSTKVGHQQYVSVENQTDYHWIMIWNQTDIRWVPNRWVPNSFCLSAFPVKAFSSYSIWRLVRPWLPKLYAMVTKSSPFHSIPPVFLCLFCCTMISLRWYLEIIFNYILTTYLICVVYNFNAPWKWEIVFLETTAIIYFIWCKKTLFFLTMK